MIYLNQCNAITLNNIIATGVRESYKDNNSIVFIFVGTPNADKRLGVNILATSIFCERVNTICKSTASFLQINNVYCNENYSLTNVFHIQKTLGETQNTCIILQNINCSNYTGFGVYSDVKEKKEEIGDITFNYAGNRPIVKLVNSDELTFSSISGLSSVICESQLKQSIGKEKNIYYDFNSDLNKPTDRDNFLLGDVKLNSSFTSNVNEFKNLIGSVLTYKNSRENQWAPIQLGIPTFNKYSLRDVIKGTFLGQIVYNETDNCLSFWNGSKWVNVENSVII